MVDPPSLMSGACAAQESGGSAAGPGAGPSLTDTVASAEGPHGPTARWDVGWEIPGDQEVWGQPVPALPLPHQTSCLQYLDARNTPLLDHSAPFVARALRIRSSLAVLHLENASLSGRPLMLLGELRGQGRLSGGTPPAGGWGSASHRALPAPPQPRR